MQACFAAKGSIGSTTRNLVNNVRAQAIGISYQIPMTLNAFLIKFIDSCIKNFINKRLTEKPVTLTAEKKELVIVLPFLGKSSLTRLNIVSVKTFPFVKLELFLNLQHVIPIFSSAKIKWPIACVSNFSCVRSNDTYYGKIWRYLSVKVGKKSTEVKDHIPFCDQIISIDDFKSLATSDSDFYVKVKESVLI